MKLQVDYKLSGCVNNGPVQVTGSGVADLSVGRYSMDLECEQVPIGWDPAFIIMICCDLLIGSCAREVNGAQNVFSVSRGRYSVPERRAVIYDAACRKMGDVAATSHGWRDGNMMFSRSHILAGDVRFCVGEEIVEIDAPLRALMRPFGDDMILATSGYAFTTNLGGRYRGYSVYPFHVQDQRTIKQDQVLTLDEVAFERSDDRRRFSYETHSTVDVLGLSAR